MADVLFIGLQTLASIFVALIGLITALSILQRDRKYILNRLFASGLVLLGISMFFLASANIPILLFPERNNDFTTVWSMKVFLVLLALTVVAFLLSSLVLYYGANLALSPKIYLFLAVYIIVNFYVALFTDSIIAESNEGDIKTGFWVIAIVFPSILFVYVLTFFFFVRVYQQIDSDSKMKANIKMFLTGWLISGGAIILAGLSNLVTYRGLDLIAPLLLAVAMGILHRGFR